MSQRINDVPTGGFNGEIRDAVAHAGETGNAHEVTAADIPTASGESVQEMLDQCIIYPGGSTGGEGGEGGTGTVSVQWTDILGKPETFPPSAHAHAIADVTGLEDALASLAGGSGGGSGVISVNGHSGVVALSATDVGADAAGTAQAVQNSLDNHVFAIAGAHAIAAITGLTDALNNLQNRIDNLQNQINAMAGTIEIQSMEYTGSSFAEKTYTLQFAGGAAPTVTTTPGWAIETGTCD